MMDRWQSPYLDPASNENVQQTDANGSAEYLTLVGTLWDFKRSLVSS